MPNRFWTCSTTGRVVEKCCSTREMLVRIPTLTLFARVTLDIFAHHCFQGKCAKTNPLDERATEIWVKALGPEPTMTSGRNSRNNLEALAFPKKKMVRWPRALHRLLLDLSFSDPMPNFYRASTRKPFRYSKDPCPYVRRSLGQTTHTRLGLGSGWNPCEKRFVHGSAGEVYEHHVYHIKSKGNTLLLSSSFTRVKRICFCSSRPVMFFVPHLRCEHEAGEARDRYSTAMSSTRPTGDGYFNIECVTHWFCF